MEKTVKLFAWAAGIFAAALTHTPAQPAAVTITNYVTVMVTNVITVTNFVADTPAPATKAPVASAAPMASVAPPPAAQPPKYPWKNSISVGMTITRGNSQSTLVSAKYEAERKTPADEYKLAAGISYGSQKGVENVNNYKASGQWNHLYSDRVYALGRVDALRDIVADVDYRVNVGPGAGFYLLKTTNTTLAAEAGGSFEAQRLDDKGDSVFATVRPAERFEHKLNDHVRFWQNFEFLPQVDRLDNYIINFEAGVETALSKSFSLKTFLDNNYDSRPAPGKAKNDAKIVAALGYKF